MRPFCPKEEVPLDPKEMNLSLNGCGYLGIYHVGVCSAIKKYYPSALRSKISGGSVGALVACAFMCDVPLDICAKYVFDVSMKVRDGILGPMSPDLNIMKILHESMDAMLPDDAHLHCDGRLHVSVTRFATGNNVLLNSFKSREDLLQALMCSCFIPVYCGYEPPEFYGVAYVDAALSNNSPTLNKHTVAVAPFSGNSDICPENDGLFLKSLTLSNTSIGLTAKNMYMLFRVLFPASPDFQKEICQQGYNDALRFLRNKGLLDCLNCVANVKNSGHPKCNPPEGTIPMEISNEIEKAIVEFRKNLGYRLFQYRSMKVLYYLNMPSIVTAKVSYIIISAILQKVQSKAGPCVDDIWSHFLKVLKNGLYRPGINLSLQSRKPDISQSDNPSCYVIGTGSDLESLEDNPEYAISVSNDDVGSDTENSDTATDCSCLEEESSQFAPNENPYDIFPVSMTTGQTYQLDLPLADNQSGTQMKERLETCVY